MGVIGHVFHHFRADVVEGTAESVPVPVGVHAPPEVSHLDGVIPCQEDVLGLEVAVDDVELVHVLQGTGHLPDVD